MGDSLLAALVAEVAIEGACVRAAPWPASTGPGLDARGWWATLALRVEGASRAPLHVGLAPGVVERWAPRPSRPLSAATAVPRRAAVGEQPVALEVLIGRCRATAKDLHAVARGDVLLFDADDGGMGELRRRASDRPLGSVSVGASEGRWAARIDAWAPRRTGVPREPLR
jgi:hypothetical protein